MQLIFVPYCPYLFTIRLVFLPLKDTENSKKECKRIYHNNKKNEVNEKAKIYINDMENMEAR
jgi:hypothetical protein